MWEEWCEGCGGASSEEESKLLLLCWLGDMSVKGWSVAKLNRVLAGVAFGLKWRRLPDLTKDFVVAQAVRGFRRGRSTRDTRWPVGFQLLERLGEVVDGICRSPYEAALFRLAFVFAFFGALRIGELVAPSGSKLGGLLRTDVEVYPGRVEFWVRKSKTDQAGAGRKVVLGQLSGSGVCPVRCLESYLRVRLDGALPLLCHADGSYLSRYQFTAIFRRGLSFLGLDPSRFAPHSFRIGAATEAASWGLGAEVVKKIGRWDSDRYRGYIRPHWV
ncbi:integrase/recombinase xerD homolog [Dendropsophus ebraccatus]|uniref:integrase/recombinase xerD homolog n=1 Tax=Dendropsophus ebraccatus TaxID=150705 RepID=UPI0038317660